MSKSRQSFRGRCILCGEDLGQSNLNDEDIISKWLARHTNTTTMRHATFFAPTGKPVYLPPGRLKFQVHELCNSEFSRAFERPVSDIFKIIRDRGSINAAQCVILLDWLDKLRSSLHLAVLQLEGKNGIKPTDDLFPKNRIRARDRAALFFTIDGHEDSLSWLGPATSSFQLTPSVLFLVVNDVAIISASSTFINSAALNLGDFLTTPTRIEPRPAPRHAGIARRKSRLPPFFIAQPIWRRHLGWDLFAARCRAGEIKLPEMNDALEGLIYFGSPAGISPLSSGAIDFSKMPRLGRQAGMSLGLIETVELLATIKMRDLAAAQLAGDKLAFNEPFRYGLDALLIERMQLISSAPLGLQTLLAKDGYLGD